MYIWVACKTSRNLGGRKGVGRTAAAEAPQDGRGRHGSSFRIRSWVASVWFTAQGRRDRRRTDELVSLRSPPPTMDAVDLFQWCRDGRFVSVLNPLTCVISHSVSHLFFNSERNVRGIHVSGSGSVDISMKSAVRVPFRWICFKFHRTRNRSVLEERLK